ncbi:hypothetical protein IMAU40093_00557 [Lactobacillus helveticus]|nr:hypothetical protein [Lactobacillus helveticus]
MIMKNRPKNWRITFAVITIAIGLIAIYANVFLNNSSPFRTWSYLGLLIIFAIIYFVDLKTDPKFSMLVGLFMLIWIDGQVWLPSFIAPYRGLIFTLIFICIIAMEIYGIINWRRYKKNNR